jgi:hypothetical protein
MEKMLLPCATAKHVQRRWGDRPRPHWKGSSYVLTWWTTNDSFATAINRDQKTPNDDIR